MKRNIIYCCLIFLTIILLGCPGANDSLTWKDLGHEYMYYEQLGLPTISNIKTHKGIPGVVFDYDYNNEFIIALEKDIQISKELKEKLIMNGEFYDFVLHYGYSKYWIIVHANDSIYGPFNKEEYKQKLADLVVSAELKFGSEE